MKTTSVYHGFAMQYEELNKQIVERVIATAPVERLCLLGLTIAYNRTETLFTMQSATRRGVEHYYLLVLVDKEDDLSLHCVQDKIEGNLQHLLPVTAIVLSEAQFCKRLLEGHPLQVGYTREGTTYTTKMSSSYSYQTTAILVILLCECYTWEVFVTKAKKFMVRTKFLQHKTGAAR